VLFQSIHLPRRARACLEKWRRGGGGEAKKQKTKSNDKRQKWIIFIGTAKITPLVSTLC
jgi:hypothetical protein